ncbi:2'-5' RNA ligase family protein [Micromonospora sp. WMMA1363]|uniref:2'-5' RNA ligase family protein n=1 Tax=Micromonospora sp. WMMA1363 TaxID=3053985 RepID=UPI00259C9B01|nr:2'-5' RNA ligase family protein [Micromonospora sp. WMMA1363]MDM4720151.1 2'-5' RNA ligase family protein [Micromonospora sp. WMMA1363]
MTSPDHSWDGSGELEYPRSDWDQYRQLDRLVDHWKRPGWGGGRRSYHWIIRFDDSPEVQRLAARCQARLGHLRTLDLAPVSSLHMTLQRVSFTDEITSAQALAVAAAANDRNAGLPPFAAIVGPLTGSADSVHFSVGPHRPFQLLRHAAAAATADVRGVAAVPAQPTNFDPHISIAYNHRPTAAKPVIEQVATVRSIPPVTVRIDAVSLVELRRDGHTYAWRQIAAVPLAGEG